MIELAAEKDSVLGSSFGLFGVVKETGVDDEGLTEFSHNHFTGYPIYKDEELEFYKAFGSSKIWSSITWTKPWRWYGSMKKIGKRLKKKGLEGNMIGEGTVKGGIIVFDREGTPLFQYLEDTGDELPMDDIKAALESVRREMTTSAVHATAKEL